MERIINEDTERRFFEEMVDSTENRRRVIVGGGRGYSRVAHIHVLKTGSTRGAARRLYEVLFEILPPAVFDELTQLMSHKRKK